jgi:ketosteroid isomerase-like protein
MKLFSIAVCAAVFVGIAAGPGPAKGQSGDAAPAPRTVSAIPVESAESPEIRELQKVEDSWSTALNGRDQYGLELVLSPLFVDVSSSGDVTTRNQQVAGLVSQEDKTATTEMRVITVRVMGDVAVANGTYTLNHKVNGSQVEEKGVFTHVFQRLRSNWVCVNAQRTALNVGAAGTRAKAKAKSQAEMPFHIPLFSKSDKSDKSN